MNAKTLKALKGSIKKWKDIEERKGVDKGGYNCPLCLLFEKLDFPCESCPVAQRTGLDMCRGSPFTAWLHHYEEEHGYRCIADGLKVKCPTCKELARKEREFLESLLPEV